MIDYLAVFSINELCCQLTNLTIEPKINDRLLRNIKQQITVLLKILPFL